MTGRAMKQGLRRFGIGAIGAQQRPFIELARLPTLARPLGDSPSGQR